MQGLFSWVSIVALAAETIVSPLPSDFGKPRQSFGTIMEQSTVLGVSDLADPHVDSVASASSDPHPPPVTRPLKKSSVTIALLGDSMIDTLGPTVMEIQDALRLTYPNITVTIKNYGVGGTNIEHGIERIRSDYEYLGQKIPALARVHPDIVVLESFAYNPFPDPDGGINRHWLALARAVDTIRASIPETNIIIAATIAPDPITFGNGAPGISFTFKEKWEQTERIKAYLESTTRFATGEHLPLADAYHSSLLPDGNGDPAFINPGDHIHPSDRGRQLFSQKIVETIVTEKLLE